MIDKIKQGKKNRRKGSQFELSVRKDLESKGWIVSKWSNNVSPPFEQAIGEWVRKLEPAKHKFNPFGRCMVQGTGFPDFIAFRLVPNEATSSQFYKVSIYEVIGVEAKSNGYLSKEEREKCKWLLENKIFSKILIASKSDEGIKYKEFK